VGFFTPDQERDVGIRVRRDGAVEVGNFGFRIRNQGVVTMVGPIRHKSIKSGDEPNTLLLILRGGQRLEIYVNGASICPPIQLEQPFGPVCLGMGLWERTSRPEFKARVEFSRFTVWRLQPGQTKP